MIFDYLVMFSNYAWPTGIRYLGFPFSWGMPYPDQGRSKKILSRKSDPTDDIYFGYFSAILDFAIAGR